MMELFAAGFNAWGQLDFDTKPEHNETQGDQDPRDLPAFECILKDHRIGRPRPLLSSTLVETSSGIRHAGFPSDLIQDPILQQQLVSSRIAIAGNEQVAVISESGISIIQYSSLAHLLLHRSGDESAGKTLTCSCSGTSESPAPRDTTTITQIVASETAFAALTADGSVYTWGDERYPACLGRQVTHSTPADRPALVEDLHNLPTGPIRKIAAGGYVHAAITCGNDLYVWGGHPGRPAVIKDLSESPIPLDIEGRDIADCGVGDQHIIGLTTDGEVYVTGDNTNGQLGLPGINKTSSWTQAPAISADGQDIEGVEAGCRTSFILLKSAAS